MWRTHSVQRQIQKKTIKVGVVESTVSFDYRNESITGSAFRQRPPHTHHDHRYLHRVCLRKRARRKRPHCTGTLLTAPQHPEDLGLHGGADCPDKATSSSIS